MTMPADEVKMVIIVNEQLGMTRGKIAAQVAHAACYCQEYLRDLLESHHITVEDSEHWGDIYQGWQDNGTKKVVLEIEKELELKQYLPEGDIGAQMVKEKIIVCPVEDLGLTEVPRNSFTCVGIGPEHASKLDKYTGALETL